MKNFFKAAKVGLMIMVCALFLGIGIKAEAAGPVTGLKQTAHGYTTVEIKWNALSGVDLSGYMVEWCADKNFSGDTYRYGYVQATDEIPISGLSAGKSYWVKVTAVTGTGDSVQQVAGTTSNPLEVVTAPMSKVSNLKQTKAGATNLTLSWSAASAGANAYLVDYYKVGTDKNKQTTVTRTSCSLSKLAANTKYDIAVYAARKSSAGYVAYSADYMAKDMSTMPKKITKVKFITSGSSTNSAATVAYFSWAKSDAAQGYEYTVYGNNGKKLFKGTTTTSTPNKGVTISNKKLKNTQFMKIKVKAYITVNGKKKYGPESDVCWFAKYPPNVKKAMVGRYASDGVKISWKKMTGAKNYTVYVSTSRDSGYKKVGTTSGTSCVIKKCNGAALTTYKTYYYKVVASKKVGKKTIKSDDNWYASFYITQTYSYY